MQLWKLFPALCVLERLAFLLNHLAVVKLSTSGAQIT